LVMGGTLSNDDFPGLDDDLNRRAPHFSAMSQWKALKSALGVSAAESGCTHVHQNLMFTSIQSYETRYAHYECPDVTESNIDTILHLIEQRLIPDYFEVSNQDSCHAYINSLCRSC
jgi:hypothetical protein